MKDNRRVWEKKDSETTWLTFWRDIFPCERCGKPTHLTSSGPVGIGHAVCEECYQELHSYHIAVLTKQR